MPYFSAITPDHIKDAIFEILVDRWRGFGEPVRFYVEYRGFHFPAKAVLGIARSLATGQETRWDDFQSSVKLEPTFRHRGFRFVNADAEQINLPPALAALAR